MSDQYLGEIRIFAGNPQAVPDGWALCNGQLLAISTNQALYALLGTRYGGDGVSSFAVPNLNGRVAIHEGQGPGLSTNFALGQTVGTATETITVANLPTHLHALQVTNATASAPPVPNPATMLVGVPSVAGSNLYATVAGVPPTTGQFAPDALQPSNNGGQAHANVMPYQTVAYMIATEGVFPDFQ